MGASHQAGSEAQQGAFVRGKRAAHERSILNVFHGASRVTSPVPKRDNAEPENFLEGFGTIFEKPLDLALIRAQKHFVT